MAMSLKTLFVLLLAACALRRKGSATSVSLSQRRSSPRKEGGVLEKGLS